MRKKEKRTLVMGFVVLISAVIIIGVLGYFVLTPNDIIIQGELVAKEVRVSGKLPGRVYSLLVSEGVRVNKGDTLVIIDSPEIYAKLNQAEAAQSAAQAISLKAQHGTRQEQIMAASEQLEMAKAASSYAKKTYERMNNLHSKGVISSQKFDEVETQYKAAIAKEKLALSQYEMAINGAQKEDIMAAKAQVQRAKGAVSEAFSYLSETHLVAPISGEVVEIFPKEGELIGSGSPIMNILDLNDMWVTFNIREDLLGSFKIGKEIIANVPALDNREIRLKINYIKVLGNYAIWKATKLTDEYDTRTFEVKAIPVDKEKIKDFRPGMSVILNYSKLSKK